MKPTITAALAVALALATGSAALAGPDAAEDSGRKISGGRLNGPSEVPGPGDPDGSGTFEARINPGQEQICYTLTASNIAPAAAAHIHRAPAGSAGGVVVPLLAPTTGSAETCRPIARDLAMEIIQTPWEFYVNVHNAEYPPGAIRGQLKKGH